MTTTTDGWRIPQTHRQADHVRRRAAVVHEHDGVPISVGRSQYIVPDRTRRIVERRDRGCRVPGCTASRFVEVHHIVHWDDGGPTDTANLLCLCPKHHRMHHQGLLGITGNADDPDGIEFTDGRGSPIPLWHPPDPPDQPPTCDRPYDAPPAGRMNYDWVGLGWAHPNALKQRRSKPTVGTATDPRRYGVGAEQLHRSRPPRPTAALSPGSSVRVSRCSPVAPIGSRRSYRLSSRHEADDPARGGSRASGSSALLPAGSLQLVDEAFEALACALAGHPELRADHAPGQAGAVGRECGGLDPTCGFPSS